MVQIEVYAEQNGHVIAWNYTAETLKEAYTKARKDTAQKGLKLKNYVIL